MTGFKRSVESFENGTIQNKNENLKHSQALFKRNLIVIVFNDEMCIDVDVSSVSQEEILINIDTHFVIKNYYNKVEEPLNL